MTSEVGRDLLIGLDLGTSTVKGVLVSANGKMIAKEQCAIQLMRPQAGWVEFSATENYHLVCKVIQGLVAKVPTDGRVRALSLAAASGNTVLVDDHGEPLRNAVSWMDDRIKNGWQSLLPGLEAKDIYTTVGWPFSGAFPLAHLAWLKDHQPKLWDKAAKRIMWVTYVLHRLTGNYVIEPSTGTTSFLQDQAAGVWHVPFLDALGIDESCLPEIVGTGKTIGSITAKAANETGLPGDTQVVSGAFDHPCAARGVGVTKPGQAMLSCGTSWVGFFPVPDRNTALHANMLADPFMAPKGPWGGMLSVPSIGVAVDRCVRRIFSGHPAYDKFDRAAARAPVGAHGATREILESGKNDLKGAEGVLKNHSPDDASRAVMESVTLLFKRKAESAALAGVTVKQAFMVGGPALSPAWTKIVCDCLGLELTVGFGQHAGAAGAAVLAGTSLGSFWDEKAGCAPVRFDSETLCPDKDANQEFSRLYQHCMEGTR